MSERLETVLACWRAGNGPFKTPPRDIEVIAGGQSNEVYRLTADGAAWALRLDSKRPDVPGIDRRREIRIQTAAAAAALAPPVKAADPEQGYLLSGWLEGKQIGPGALDRGRLMQLVRLLARVHALDPQPRTALLDYRAHCLNYLIGNGRPHALPPELERSIAAVEVSSPVGLCHHDPGPGNVVFTAGGPRLIDWEYAVRGRVMLDFAALVTDWQLSETVVADLARVDRAALRDAVLLYGELCRLWSLARR